MTLTHDDRKQYILVVDEDCARGRALAAALGALGCYTAIAASGAEAIRYAMDNEPDALLVAWDLSGMDGPELSRQIALRQLESKVVLRKDGADWRMLRRAFECGAEDVLPSSCSPESVLQVLERNRAHAGWRHWASSADPGPVLGVVSGTAFSAVG